MNSVNPTPDVNLRAAAKLFEERNPIYGGTYQLMGPLLIAMFRDGIPNITTVADANRLNILINCLNKLSRYAQNLTKGGHLDSARDLQVYAAMLEEMTDAK